jgi:hypothetical protein
MVGGKASSCKRPSALLISLDNTISAISSPVNRYFVERKGHGWNGVCGSGCASWVMKVVVIYLMSMLYQGRL